MSRTGSKLFSDSDYLSAENALNDMRDLLDQQNVSVVASNRQVTVDSAARVQVTPTANATELHIFNALSVTLRYGGDGVTTSTGGKIFSQGTLVMRVNSNTSIYLIPESGGSASIEIIEFS